MGTLNYLISKAGEAWRILKRILSSNYHLDKARSRTIRRIICRAELRSFIMFTVPTCRDGGGELNFLQSHLELLEVHCAGNIRNQPSAD